MFLNAKQQKQVALQVAAHKHQKYVVTIELTDGVALKDFTVMPQVLRPEVMSALFLARWLYFNNGLYAGKTVIDIGCGSGLQGIVAGLYGARKVVFTDIAPEAVGNTVINVKQYGLANSTAVYQGDLFEKVNEKAEIIIFNHPFFSDGTMEEQITVDASTINRGQLIHRFFEDAKQHLLPGGKIIMPYFHLAGAINDPAVQAPAHGYSVETRWHINVTTGLQKGRHSIYELSFQ
jgi:methylase of polypeptide subunit release factors